MPGLVAAGLHSHACNIKLSAALMFRCLTCPTAQSYQQVNIFANLAASGMSIAAQAVAVCASETRVGGAYIAVVTEAPPALPEIPDVEEEAELAEEAPIASPGEGPCS